MNKFRYELILMIKSHTLSSGVITGGFKLVSRHKELRSALKAVEEHFNENTLTEILIYDTVTREELSYDAAIDRANYNKLLETLKNKD